MFKDYPFCGILFCIFIVTVILILSVLYKDESAPLIPKTIHQCYNTSKIPKVLQDATKKLRKMNPEYTYKFYTDKDIDRYMLTYFPNIYKDFKTINPKYGPARSDLFRYCVIYNEGGVYLDLKSGTNIPLKHIIKNNDEFLLSSWKKQYRKGALGMPSTPWGELQQWHVIARPKHPLLKMVINEVVQKIRNYKSADKITYPLGKIGKNGVMYCTGPITYTQVIFPHMHQNSVSFKKNSYNNTLVYDAIKNKKLTPKQLELWKNKKDKTTGLSNHVLLSDKPHYSELTESIIL